MRRASAFGRDKPHSPSGGAARGSAPNRADPQPDPQPDPGRSHALAIGLGLVLAALLVAVSPLPAAPWLRAEHPPAPPSEGALGWLWDALLLALPVAERGLRGELAALLLVLALAAAAGLLCARLYRGTGRGLAAAAAVPLTTALLLAWLREAPTDAVTALASSLAATTGLAIFMGARRGGGLDWVQGGLTLLVAALLEPRFGPGLAALLIGHALWHREPGRGVQRALMALVPVALLVVWAWSFGHVFMDLRIAVPEISGLARRVGPALLYPALALLVLLVLPLRWRGGGPLLALAAVSLVLVDRAGPLAPEPMRLMLVAVAACGWVWLAGSVEVHTGRRWLARCGAGVAMTALLGWIVWHRAIVDEPVAARRSVSLLALQQRGLIAPGDVLIAHEPWLAATFAAAQRDEGLRPDVEVYAAAELDPGGLSEQLARWARAGRRVLSDSFSYGGRWRADWVLDSGPLFWFIGTAAADAHEFTDIRPFTPDLADPGLTPGEQARWERLQLERARHRRALGRHDEAVQALPLADADLAELMQQLQLARLSRLPAVEGSELGPTPWSTAPPPASALAEAGDLLLALGDGPGGAARLDEAAALGVAEAFAALARWQLRAGQEEAARNTLTEISTDPGLRGQLLEVCRWLLVRGRARQAAGVLAGAAAAPGHAPEELGLRLAVLRGLARP